MDILDTVHQRATRIRQPDHLSPRRNGWENCNCSAWKTEGSRRNLINILQISEGRLHRRQNWIIASGAQIQHRRQWEHTETREAPTWTWGSISLSCDGDGALAQVAQRECGDSLLGDLQKPSGYSPRDLAVAGPAWAGGWTRWRPEVPSKLCHSVILQQQKGNL